MIKNKTVLMYHKDCVDGFTSMFIAYSALISLGINKDNILLMPMDYTSVIEANKFDSNVIFMLDFTVSPKVLEELLSVSTQITVLDHHANACEQIKGLEEEYLNFSLICEKDICGALISYNFFQEYLDKELLTDNTKAILDLINDHDLWKKEFEDTIYLATYLYKEEFTIDNWKRIFSTPVEESVKNGKVLFTFLNETVKEHVDHSVHFLMIGGILFPSVCGPVSIKNIACEYMYNKVAQGDYDYKYPVAAFYTILPDSKVKVSLRSKRIDGSPALDVSAITREFNGNGHKSAAGFVCSIDDLKEFMIY